MNETKLLLSLILVFWVSTHCAKEDFSFSARAQVNGFGGAPVCQIGDVPTQKDSGLIGDIYYLDPSQPRYSSVNDFITYGHHVDNPLILSQVDVPTRMFDTGFAIQNGDYVRDNNGQILIEYFGLKLEASLRLKAGDASGNYQFAVISDDGSTFEMQDQNGKFQMVINNDGVQSSKLGCSSNVINMTQNVDIPVRIKYFQGPRYHIALVLLWRKVDGNTPPDNNLCGNSGNTYWFDPGVSPSQPTANYQQLLSYGWHVVGADNFKIPGNQANPCL